ncbi:HEAT repeat domain-containing protein [Cystobacter fuscus]|uniref:HEAT repeat domain-containing protein n=1 Tax=Cystobacter fuscus TaxID=43 RepID=UPI0037BF19EC
MDSRELTRRIIDVDYSVQLEVMTAGTKATPALVPLLHHEDEDVRTLTAHCLAFTGGPLAAQSLAGAIADPSLNVAGAALASLEKFSLGAMPEIGEHLLGYLRRPLEPVLRQRIPIVLLQGGSVPAMETLRSLSAQEQDARVREGLIVLLAKLGAPEAREEVIDKLMQAAGGNVRRWAEYINHLQGRWLVRPLVSWLEKEFPAVRVGVDGVQHIPEYLRACDIAVNWLFSYTGVRLSFIQGPLMLYTSEQRAEVRDQVNAWLSLQEPKP